MSSELLLFQLLHIVLEGHNGFVLPPQARRDASDLGHLLVVGYLQLFQAEFVTGALLV